MSRSAAGKEDPWKIYLISAVKKTGILEVAQSAYKVGWNFKQKWKKKIFTKDSIHSANIYTPYQSAVQLGSSITHSKL